MRGQVSTLKRLTVGDIHGHSVNRSKLYCFNTTNGERNMLNVYQLLDLPFAANHVRTFQNYHICVYFN